MAEDPGPRRSATAEALDELGPALDKAMPWAMAGWAFLGFFALPIDEAYHVANGAPLTGLLAGVVAAWALLAGAAAALAVRHARDSAAPARHAWALVPVVLALALPFALAMLAEHDYTEDDDKVCSPGLLPEAVLPVLFGWVPWRVYPWLPLATGLTGLALLAPRATRRPAAWILASTLLGTSLAIAGMTLVVNHCD